MEEIADVAARQQANSLPLPSVTPVFQRPEGGGEDTTASLVKSEKTRRRGSLSISRFGQVRRSLLRAFHDAVLKPPPFFADPRAFRRYSPQSEWCFSNNIRRIIARSQIPIICSASSEFCGLPSFDHSPFIRSSLPCSQAPSVDSFGSAEQVHEVGPIDDHVTQMRHISGKPSISKAVGGMISRTLSTRRSKNDLKVVNSPNLFIGVSVTEHEQELEASELENESEADKQLVVTTTTVHAPLKKQTSKRNLGSSTAEEQGDWISRARKFGQKIRRKSQALLIGQEPKAVTTASPTTTTATN